MLASLGQKTRVLSFLDKYLTIKFMEKHRITVVLPSIRSLFNVGSFFRTADATAVEKIYCCGTTGTPKNKKLLKVSLGSELTVPWEYAADPMTCVLQLQKAGYQIVVVEKTKQSTLYTQIKYSNKVALIFGSETCGVSELLLQQANVVAHLPMFGKKNSLNVAVVGGVLLYYLRSLD
ncbi:MAG: tRNA/rRNA methyltransferase (SpoU) [uncultured bacterium]|nr:MAG: tRNA/rRNA methyltransferase (SpoU) [uncultured bacterium]